MLPKSALRFNLLLVLVALLPFGFVFPVAYWLDYFRFHAQRKTDRSWRCYVLCGQEYQDYRASVVQAWTRYRRSFATFPI